MTFLAKLGSILARVVGVATGVEPIVNTVLPNSVQAKIAPISSELTDIAGELAAAEQVFQTLQAQGNTLTDAQKLAVALPYISQIVNASPLMSNKKIANEDQFKSGLSNLTSAVEQIVNSLETK